MQINLFKALLSFIAFKQCYSLVPPLAVTWRRDNCPANFMFNGATLDQIWDNAASLAVNAQLAIAGVPTSAVQVLTASSDDRRSGGNAQLIWGPKYSKATGADSTLQNSLAFASGGYADALKGLKKTLTATNGATFDLNNAIIFCGNTGFQQGIPPGSSFLSAVWYYPIVTGTAPNQITEYLVPSYSSGFGAPMPCTETGDAAYNAMTSMATQVINGVETPIVSIMICPNRRPTQPATLTNPFTTTGNTGNPDTYFSMAGTILHEMLHVVGYSRNEDWSDKTELSDAEGNYGFVKCVALAKASATDASKNPDSYRIFAEMSFSPATEWTLPPPAPAAAGAAT